MDNINIDITDNGDNVVVTISQGITTVWADQITITGTGTFGDPLVGVAGAADMLKAVYDPTNVSADAFDYNNLHTTAVGDGITITGTGTTLDPFVSVGGSGATDGITLKGDGQAGTEYALRRDFTSGLISGGIITVNGGDASKFDISAGTGVIVDFWTTPGVPVYYNVTIPAQNAVSVTNIGTSTLSYIGVDNTGAIVQYATEPTNAQRRDIILLAQLGHTNLTTIGAVNSYTSAYDSAIETSRDIISELHLVSTGNRLSANGANLKLNKSAGTLFGLGINFINDDKNPNRVTTGALVALSFRYRTQLGGATGLVSDIDPTKHDLGGVITAFAGVNKATNQRVFLFPNNNVVIQYGQQVYNTLQDAIEGVQLEQFVEYQNVAEAGLCIGILSVTNGCTSLADTTKAKFISVTKFGENIGGSAGISTTTLQGAYNNSVTPEIVTDATRGAVTLRRGSGADTDTVSEIQNGAGNVKHSVTGNGVIFSDSLTASEILATDASKNIVSLPVSTYPSLTELSYVKGATSAIQTQLNAKVPTSRNITINGVTQDLSADRTWTVSASVRLNELLAANGANTIDNVANLQTWTWNSLTSGNGLTLSSSSTGAASNTQNILAINQTGANVTGGQTTYALRVSNTKTGATNINIAGQFTASGAANGNIAIDLVGDGRIQDNSPFLFGTGATGTGTSAGIRTNTASFQFQVISATSQCINLISKIARGVLASDSAGVVYINLGNNSSTKHSISFGGDTTGTTTYRAVDTTTAVIEQDGGKLHLCANTGLAGGFGTYTPNQIVTINGGATVAASNVGIGNASPNASALLDLTSTTKGFLKPRVTTVQRDAIASVSTGLSVYNTTLNNNNTYNGVNWTGDVIIDSGATLTLKHGVDYFFSGTTATWTLPAINSAIAGRMNAITIKNRGTGNLTVNTNAAANVLFTTALTNTFILAVGDSVVLMPDGTYFNVE